MNDQVTVRRIDFNTFEITMNDEPKIFRRTDCVRGIFGCFGIIDHFYGAVKGAYGARKEEPDV